LPPNGAPTTLVTMTDRSTLRSELIADGVFVAVRLGPDRPLLDLCRAVIAGGLRLMEITLTTPGAVDAIAALADDDCVPGAGTVLTVEDVDAVADAGARFVMSPALDPEIIDAAHARGLVAVPGTGTATEILMAHRAGADLVKVFPAGPLGGPEFIRSVRGPLPGIPLVPTSGPGVDTIADYVAAGVAAVGVGSWLFADDARPDETERRAREVRRAMDAARA
jgi:2-dehydro-3-deoxyphosphogluconate aldolase/(4S)-4-hydroxy-2-oxoglutarate aldolase